MRNRKGIAKRTIRPISINKINKRTVGLNINSKSITPKAIGYKRPSSFPPPNFINSDLYSYDLDSKIAMYTTINENYVENSIISFCTFKELNPGSFDFFIFGYNFSKNAIKKIKDNNITYVNTNLNNAYKIDARWKYPSECYWLFYAPDYLSQINYKHSVYVDADVICNKKIPLGWVGDIDIVAGSVRNLKHSTAGEFIYNVDKDMKTFSHFNIRKQDDVYSMNTGVLFFNNDAWRKHNLFKFTKHIFDESKKINKPRLGDDSLFSLILLLDNKFNYKTKMLPIKYNNFHYNKNSTDWKYSYILHSHRKKPWAPIDGRDTNDEATIHIKTKWQTIKNKLKQNGKL